MAKSFEKTNESKVKAGIASLLSPGLIGSETGKNDSGTETAGNSNAIAKKDVDVSNHSPQHLNSTSVAAKQATSQDPEGYTLTSYHFKNRHLETFKNFLHWQRTAGGQSLMAQKDALAMIMEAGFAHFGDIPERPEEVKIKEQEKKRKKD